MDQVNRGQAIRAQVIDIRGGNPVMFRFRFRGKIYRVDYTASPEEYPVYYFSFVIVYVDPNTNITERFQAKAEVFVGTTEGTREEEFTWVEVYIQTARTIAA